MGSIFRRGKKWYLSYTDPNGKRVKKSVSLFKETAVKVLNKIETQIAEGKYLDVKKQENILFEDFADRYYDAYVKLENRCPEDQKYLLNGLVKQFRGQYLHQVTPFSIRQYLAERTKTVRPGTVNKDLTMLKSLFNRAIEWSVLSGDNPTKGIKKLPENNERCRWLTEEEQDRLLCCLKGAGKMIALIALKTGMRWGEIVNLKWQQSPKSNYVNFDNNIIFIHESLTKGKKSRHIPMAFSIKEALSQYPQQEGTDYIFLNPKTDKPISQIRKSFDSALKRAGIKDFRFHDLRHCFAADLARKGASLYKIQVLLGHSSSKMTQRYANLCPDDLRDTIDLLEKRDCLKNEFMYNKNSFSEQNVPNLSQRHVWN